MMPPLPEFESHVVEIIFRTDSFYVQKILHRKGGQSSVSYEVVAFPGAKIKFINGRIGMKILRNITI